MLNDFGVETVDKFCRPGFSLRHNALLLWRGAACLTGRLWRDHIVSMTKDALDSEIEGRREEQARLLRRLETLQIEIDALELAARLRPTTSAPKAVGGFVQGSYESGSSLH